MLAEPGRLLTRDEYLAFERASELRHEYVAGEVFAMSRVNADHSMIAVNTGAWIRPQLRGTGRFIYMTNMRVKIEALGIYTYPDLVVTCGNAQIEDSYDDTLLNPIMIIEVFSPATENYDRGLKFRRYQLIPTFAEYLLIAQDRTLVEHRLRLPDGTWQTRITDDPTATLTLPSIGCTLPLTAIYEDITWDTEA